MFEYSKEENHVDFTLIVNKRTRDERLKAVKSEVDRCGFVSLTDVYTHYNQGGAMVIEYLDKVHKSQVQTGVHRTWKIRILKDEWGNKPAPGDVYLRKVNKPFRDIAGRKMTGSAINDAKRRGTFERDFVDVREYVIDEKGCIECALEDAGWMLSEHGVRYDDNSIAICGRREFSGGPCKCPDGGLKHIHYWRFAEAPPWTYDELPRLNKDGEPRKARSTTKPKTDKPSNPTDDIPSGGGGGQE